MNGKRERGEELFLATLHRSFVVDDQEEKRGWVGGEDKCLEEEVALREFFVYKTGK